MEPESPPRVAGSKTDALVYTPNRGLRGRARAPLWLRSQGSGGAGAEKASPGEDTRETDAYGGRIGRGAHGGRGLGAGG